MSNNTTITNLNKTNDTTNLIDNSNITFPSDDDDNLNEHEDEIKRAEYYKSNPLRNYAPTKGQTILPSPLISSKLKRKQLPNVFKELSNSINSNNISNEETKLIYETTHKYKLKTDLKVNLSFTEEINRKNLLDIRENSRKIYNEYCRKNVTKPIDIKNIHSSLKSLTSTNNNNNNHLFSGSVDSIQQQQQQQTSNIDSNLTIGMTNSTQLNTITAPITHRISKNNEVTTTTTTTTKMKNIKTKTPLIDVKRVHISTLEDMIDEIKNKNKYKNLNRIIYDNYDNQNIKYSYKENNNQTIKFSEYLDLSSNNLLVNHTDSFLNHVHYDIDELELMHTNIPNHVPKGNNIYKRVNKLTPLESNTNDIENEIEYLKERRQQQQQQQQQQLNDNQIQHLRTQNSPNHRQTIQSQQTAYSQPQHNSALSYINAPINGLFLKPDDEYDINQQQHQNSKNNLVYVDRPLLSPNTKHKLRVQHARDKVSSLSNNEKTNLNKLTIIQPFEDTKILINLDQVPAKALNTLFNYNNQIQQPNYLIPPVKAFGFFTSKNQVNDYVMPNPTITPPATVKTGIRQTLNSKIKHGENNGENLRRNNNYNNRDRDSLSSSCATPGFSVQDFNTKSKFIKSNNSNVIYTQ